MPKVTKTLNCRYKTWIQAAYAHKLCLFLYQSAYHQKFLHQYQQLSSDLSLLFWTERGDVVILLCVRKCAL